uniref:Uncharacterized protein n=1 Tax=Sphaerodactylus townsendi TaxID=933632 RepID=A0ACB8G5F0_9SAUR
MARATEARGARNHSSLRRRRIQEPNPVRARNDADKRAKVSPSQEAKIPPPPAAQEQSRPAARSIPGETFTPPCKAAASIASVVTVAIIIPLAAGSDARGTIRVLSGKPAGQIPSESPSLLPPAFFPPSRARATFSLEAPEPFSLPYPTVETHALLAIPGMTAAFCKRH